MSSPMREIFPLLSENTAELMLLILIPFAIIFLYGFYRRFRLYGFGDIVKGIMNDPLGSFNRLLEYGLFQKKILWKKYEGIIHLNIYLGTAILFIGTSLVFIEFDILRFFHVSLLRGSFYLVFEFLLDVFGTIFLIGVTIALFRRLLSKPAHIGKRTEYTIALSSMLYIGLTGFVIEGLRLYAKPVPWAGWSIVGAAISTIFHNFDIPPDLISLSYQILWWSHTLVAYGLVTMVPYTNLGHILVSALNVMASPPRLNGTLSTPFNLTNLMKTGNFEVKVGIESVTDLDWRQRLSLDACTDCGRCQEVCPADISGTPLSPRRLIQNLKTELYSSLLHNRMHQRNLFEYAVKEDEAWACTFCGACVQVCPVLIDPISYIIDLRRELVWRSRLDRIKGSLLNNLANTSNPYGLSSMYREDFARELGIQILRENSRVEYAYWVGCAAVYDPRVKAVSKAVVKILNRAGIAFAVLGSEEKCTGDLARRLGEEGRFQELALHNIEALRKYEAKKIITHCPHCYNTLKKEYPEFGGYFEVIHHTQLIYKLVKEKRIKPKEGVWKRVTLHDSCYLARFGGIYDEPREVLSSIPAIELSEMNRVKKNSFCCGAGGVNYWYDVPRKERIGVLRLREAISTQADLLTVECPFCLQIFEDALKTSTSKSKLRVRDLAEIVAESIE